MQYLEKIRMEKAAEMLVSGKYSVTETAGRCGYNDANYFARIFKRKYAMSPREYRLNREIGGTGFLPAATKGF